MMTAEAPVSIGTTRSTALHEALERFPASLFQFDGRMAEGWLSDRYFLRTAATLRHAGLDPVVTMQVFAKRRGIVAGIYEGIRMLQTQIADDYDCRATSRSMR